jgi:hypothetical protein
MKSHISSSQAQMECFQTLTQHRSQRCTPSFSKVRRFSRLLLINVFYVLWKIWKKFYRNRPKQVNNQNLKKNKTYVKYCPSVLNIINPNHYRLKSFTKSQQWKCLICLSSSSRWMVESSCHSRMNQLSKWSKIKPYRIIYKIYRQSQIILQE